MNIQRVIETTDNSLSSFTLKGILAKNQFCSKSQAVCVKLCQPFRVDHSLPVLNARCFPSAILGVQISRAPPFIFLRSFMGDYDVSARLNIFKIQHCVNLVI